MFYVYILKELDKNHYYTGVSSDLKNRISEHYSGNTRSTRSRKWKVYCYFAFENSSLAENFERYLKTGSGRSFAKKHFQANISATEL